MTPGLAGPIVVLAAPGGGDGVLVRALEAAAGVVAAAPGAPPFPEAVAALALGGIRDSHRLDAGDAGRRAARAARATLPGGGRPLLSGLRLALRVPFVAAALPEARFVLVQRELREALAFALDGWRSGAVVSAPDLPGWDGPPWSLPVVPGWRALSGRPLGEVVGAQWAQIADTVLTDLEALPADRWCVVDRTLLLERPGDELRRVCRFLGLPYDQALRTPVEAARRDTALRGPAPGSEDLDRALALAAPADARVRAVVAHAADRAPRVAAAADPAVAFGSRSSGSLARELERLGCSVLLTAPRIGAVVTVRARHGTINTHLTRADAPAAIAAAGDRVVVATRTEVMDFRGLALRRRHVTGAVGIADLALGGDGDDDGPWLAVPGLSALATLDAAHSVVPRVARPGGLNGVALGDDGRPAYATTRDGAVLDLAAGAGAAAAAPLADGLALPAAPRLHGGALYVVQTGTGELTAIDRATGAATTVAELPGAPVGLALAGHLAFVALAQLRDTAAAAGLPIAARLPERQAGLHAIDLRSGAAVAFLRFDDAVHETAGIALLADPWPELRGPHDGDPPVVLP